MNKESDAAAPGLVCDLLVRHLGLPCVAPFLAAVPCLASALLIISLAWPENYGASSASVADMYTQGGEVVVVVVVFVSSSFLFQE